MAIQNKRNTSKDPARRRRKREDFIKDPYLLDYIKILESKAYRRLAYKTQVISAPDNPHVRTRLVHTNEVISIASNIASGLGHNLSLCMAIGAGHDIGHTPYGHFGERVLSELGGKKFKHYVNSIVVAQHIERNGIGLNLTHNVLNGILVHSKGDGKMIANTNFPPEYNIVMFADKIAYTLSDYNDALRYGYLRDTKVPKFISRLGSNRRERIMNIVQALLKESRKKGYVSFSQGAIFRDFSRLRQFMFKEVYYKMDFDLHKEILKKIVEYFSQEKYFKGVDPIVLASLLTDHEANIFSNYLLQSKMPRVEQISNFGIMEMVPMLRKKKIDYTDPDLDW